MKEMASKYDHFAVEQGKYDFWLEHQFFQAGKDLKKPPFTVVIPPPNVTGKLHLGHTWDTTLQDIVIRRKRMQGFDALYLPGMDHAGIATQAKVDQKLRAQGINRYELGREKYLEVAWSWKEEYASLIRAQWKGIGLSLDYTRERFTLDQGLSDAVQEVFIKLYEKGYIYRGERIINWDVEAKTALSNIEIEHMEVEGALYHITYPFVDGHGGLTVATTRPETMFGDTALMVHPEDERFLYAHGKSVYIPTTNVSIPVILDDYVDKTFGTGVVKVTPAHDPNDFEVGKRHQLAMPLCMNEDGTMNARAFRYLGMERFACRKQVLADLKPLGLLQKIEPIKHNVGHSERTGVIVEPRLSKQWFVNMELLAKHALDQSTVEFVPERFEKIFNNWMESIEDWCISRQLWWGHRIPVWYKGDQIHCSKTPPKGDGWRQDEDVLDTWFSSALWPFSTLGWPQQTADLNRYYPTDVLVTGYDIIFFWVARMIFQAIEFTGKSPFKHCLIHGLIRDTDGRKMSKSLGNGVDPSDVIEQFGADALRYFITTNSSPGLDLRYETEKVEAAWNFINKLWNMSRFVLMNTEGMTLDHLAIDEAELGFPEQFILDRMNQMIREADQYYERFEFGEAAKVIYNFAWNDYAAWYLEMAKIRANRTITKQVLIRVLTTIIKMLHPFMPFVTEEIYQLIPHEEPSITIAAWPETHEFDYPHTRNQEWFFELIRKIRTLRNDYGVGYQRQIELHLAFDNESDSALLNENLDLFTKFTNPEPLVIGTARSVDPNAIQIIIAGLQATLPLGSLVDLQAEIDRLQKELSRLETEIKRSEGLIKNPNFLAKAPADKLAAEQAKYDNYKALFQQTKGRIEALKQ
jgi:valyl-tRNA synthetase